MIGFAIWLVLLVAGDAPPPVPPLPPPVAAAGFVAVIAPPPGDRLLDESSSRVRSELAASGLDSRFVDCLLDTDGQPRECASPDALATIMLAREDGLIAIRVHAVAPDGLELSRVVRVQATEGSDDPAVLAIRAVELLRDVRLDMARPPPPPAAPGRAARDDEDPRAFTPVPPPEAPAPWWWLSCGPAMLASAATGGKPGLGPSFGVALEFDVALLRHLSAIVALAGPFNRALVPPAGQATLLQALAQLGVRYRFDVWRLHPFAEAFIGVDYLNASITQPAVGSGSASTSVPLGGAGAGVSADFLRRFRATLEADVFATEPQVSTTVALQNLGRAGSPSFLVSASVGVGFP